MSEARKVARKKIEWRTSVGTAQRLGTMGFLVYVFDLPVIQDGDLSPAIAHCDRVAVVDARIAL